MIIRSAELETVCGITSKLPENKGYEIAFAGKSNVGKSSLINGLLNRKALARTSSQPGKTQTINFYYINDSFYFVDLPGYGYAKVSVSEREKWGKMIERYLHTSKQLVLVFLGAAETSAIPNPVLESVIGIKIFPRTSIIISNADRIFLNLYVIIVISKI